MLEKKKLKLSFLVRNTIKKKKKMRMCRHLPGEELIIKSIASKLSICQSLPVNEKPCVRLITYLKRRMIIRYIASKLSISICK
jgi:hypothetical protein